MDSNLGVYYVIRPHFWYHFKLPKVWERGCSSDSNFRPPRFFPNIGCSIWSDASLRAYKTWNIPPKCLESWPKIEKWFNYWYLKGINMKANIKKNLKFQNWVKIKHLYNRIFANYPFLNIHLAYENVQNLVKFLWKLCLYISIHISKN